MFFGITISVSVQDPIPTTSHVPSPFDAYSKPCDPFVPHDVNTNKEHINIRANNNAVFFIFILLFCLPHNSHYVVKIFDFANALYILSQNAPFVKSGNPTGAPPLAMDASESGVTAIHAAASYTSMGQGVPLRTASTNASYTRPSMPP